jgi:AcrR family transcriptional regulator
VLAVISLLQSVCWADLSREVTEYSGLVSASGDGEEPRLLTPRGQATRDRIVVAAAALMFEKGVASTTTEDIQDAAGGLSPSQIYHYFQDKRSLVRAVIALQTETILAIHTPILARLDSIESLEAWRDVIIEFQKQNHCIGGCPLGSLGGELADQDPVARGQITQGFARWETAIRDGLAAMRDRGELTTQADPHILASALLTALQGGLLMTQIRRDTTDLYNALSAVIAHISTYSRS